MTRQTNTSIEKGEDEFNIAFLVNINTIFTTLKVHNCFIIQSCKVKITYLRSIFFFNKGIWTTYRNITVDISAPKVYILLIMFGRRQQLHLQNVFFCSITLQAWTDSPLFNALKDITLAAASTIYHLRHANQSIPSITSIVQYLNIWTVKVCIALTVKCTAIKPLFLYFHLCLRVMLVSHFYLHPYHFLLIYNKSFYTHRKLILNEAVGRVNNRSLAQ